MRKARCVYNEFLQAAVGPFQIGTLGTFFTGGNYQFPRAGDSGAESFPQTGHFCIAKALKVINPYAQGYLGIDLVNVLAAWSSRAGKIRSSGNVNRLIQK
jgi:hypothetical protein